MEFLCIFLFIVGFIIILQLSLCYLIVYCVLKFQVRLGIRIWSYVREEASHGRVNFKFSVFLVIHCCLIVWWVHYISRLKLRIPDFFLLVWFLQKAPIDPFTRESCKPSASQGVPLGGMGYDLLQLKATN